MSKWLFSAVFLAGLAAAGWYFHTQQSASGDLPKAVDQQGNAEVWVFTHADCGTPCTDILQDLKKRRLAFVEKSINPNDRSNPDSQIWRRQGDKQFPLVMIGEARLQKATVPLMAGFLADHFGADVLHSGENRFFKEHFNSDGSPRIVMYSTSWCGYCRRLRQELVDNQVAFTEIDIEKHSTSKLLTSTLGIRGVPTTYVGYKRVAGSNLAAINKVIKP